MPTARITTLLLIALALLPAAAATAATPEYFDLPDGNTAGGGIAAAPDGTIWAAAGRTFGAPTIARLDPARAAAGTSAGVDLFPTPTIPGTSCCANMVRSVAFDGRHNRVWFVQSDGIAGFADPALVTPRTSNGMTATLISTEISPGRDGWEPDLWDVAVGDDGRAWFTERSTYNVAPYPGARIGWIDENMVVAELSNIALQDNRRSLDSARYDAKPTGIALDPSGRPWFAESDPGLPGWRIATPRGGGGPDYDEYLITPCAPGSPCSGSYTGTGATDVALAPDGAIWFTNQLRNELGRLDVAGGVFTAYSLPAIDAGFRGGRPIAISAAPDGTLWLAQYGGVSRPSSNAIVKVVPDPLAPSATVFPLGAGRHPLAVTADTRGNVWFAVATDVAPGKLGRLAGVVAGGTPGPGPGGGGGGGGTGGGDTTPPAGGGANPPSRPLVAASVGAARAGTPSVAGDAMRIDQICVGPPEARCSVVYILSAGEYVTGFPGARSDDRDRNRAVTAVASARRGNGRARRGRRARAVILGQKTVILRGGQRALVRVTLNAAGRRLLRRAGRLRLFFTVTERGADGRGRRIKAQSVTFRRPASRRARRR
ncbi:hypothetical protein VSS74_29405 [Conexibacter stalactiti]|uniref:Virginiamycin B lyase n=1 Tax=Conexibacter stalactiti TaxID=1940611 RepID=A0ABU4I022_9ACTN|nr:hypothetical protein [Conexibacter stalactiti]MDW5598514.1 hypothetical protein [Conexibacter stalactiti]MEC5039156.1 hypothetical protein [Conexibacter stalactiti]